MTYSDVHSILEALKSQHQPVRITIDINPGEFTVSLAEALEAFDNTAPGEPFTIATIEIGEI